MIMNCFAQNRLSMRSFRSSLPRSEGKIMVSKTAVLLSVFILSAGCAGSFPENDLNESAATLMFNLVSASATTSGKSFLMFSGIQTNVSLAGMTGWSLCYSDLYSNASTTLGTIQSACNGANLMLACRLASVPDNLLVVAHAPRSDALFDVGTGSTAFHNANGTSWYYNSSSSWGFFASGDVENRSSCDVQTGTYPNQRLCWNTSGGLINGGYRCGSLTALNTDATHERLVLQAN